MKAAHCISLKSSEPDGHSLLLQILYCRRSPAHGPPIRFLVMQVRLRTEAPPPQLREQTDHTPHVAHSFLKCSCRRARTRCPEAALEEAPQTESRKLCGEDRATGASSRRTKVSTWNRVNFLFILDRIILVDSAPVLRSGSGLTVWTVPARMDRSSWLQAPLRHQP